MTLLDQILSHPDVVKPPDRSGEAKAWCPWHADRAGNNPNLGINVKKRSPTVSCATSRRARTPSASWPRSVPTVGLFPNNPRQRNQEGRIVKDCYSP